MLGNRPKQRLEEREALNSFLDAIRTITAYLVPKVGMDMQDIRVHKNRYFFYRVRWPNLESHLGVPESFPLIYPYLHHFDEQCAEEMLSELIPIVEEITHGRRFGIVIPLTEAANLKTLLPQRKIDHQLVVLSKEDFPAISQNGEAGLGKIIVNQLESSAISAYQTEGPVPARMFFGRKRETREVLQNIRSKNYAFLGARRIGKTSFLFHLLRKLRKNPDYLTLFVDCEHLLEARQFYKETYSTVLRTGGEVPEEVLSEEGFIRFIAQLRGGEYDRVVFLLDEVDMLAVNQPEMFKALRSSSQREDCRVVLVGEKRLYNAMRDGSSPLFNFAEKVNTLAFLDFRSVKSLIVEPMTELGIRIYGQERIVQRIWDLSTGRADIVQWICRDMIKRMDEERPGKKYVLMKDLQAINQSGDFQRHLLDSMWGRATPLERLITLVMMENPSFKSREAREALHRRGIPASHKEIQTALEGLQLYNILVKEGQVYRFVPTAFAEVVKAGWDVEEELIEPVKEDWEEQRT